MGNSNSTPQAPLQWSQSLDHPPDSRNRMKKGYFPPRHYIGHGHGGMVPPQKVLPTVNPTQAALRLKPTSNGAILHKGGTISGRKLLNDHHDLRPSSPESESLKRAIRKRHLSSSSLVNMTNDGMDGDGLSGGTSTPNLTCMDFSSSNGGGEFSRRSQRSINGGATSYSNNNGGGKSSNTRDYDSEPDMRDESIASMGDTPDSPDRSVSPPNLPNTFTLISESPSKKQIRTKKKYQAPPPPMMMDVHLMSNMMQQHPGQMPFPFQNQNLNLNQHQHQMMMMGQMMMHNSQIQQHDSIDSFHNRHSNGGGGGKKKLTRLFKTKAQSKLSKQEQQQQQLQQHQQQQQQQQQQHQRILAESVLTASHTQNGNSSSTQWNSSNHHQNNNSNSNSAQNGMLTTNMKTNGMTGQEREDSGRNASRSHIVGMTTNMSEQIQLEKLSHTNGSGQSRQVQVQVQQQQGGSGDYNMQRSKSNNSSKFVESEGRKLPSSSNEIALAAAAAAAVAGKKKKPFAPLCATKEDNQSGRGGGGLAINAPVLSREVISGRQASLATSSVVGNNNNIPTTTTSNTTSSQSRSQSSSNNNNGSSSNAHHGNSVNNLNSNGPSGNNGSSRSEQHNSNSNNNKTSSNNNNISSDGSHNNHSNLMTENGSRVNNGNDKKSQMAKQKKTFYFGMDLGNSSTVQEVAPSLSQSPNQLQNNLDKRSSTNQMQMVNGSNNRPPSTELSQEELLKVKRNQLNGHTRESTGHNGGGGVSESTVIDSRSSQANKNKTNHTNANSTGIGKQQQKSQQPLQKQNGSDRIGVQRSQNETPQLHKDETTKAMQMQKRGGSSSKPNNGNKIMSNESTVIYPSQSQSPEQHQLQDKKKQVIGTNNKNFNNNALIHSQRSESDSDGLTNSHPHHKRQDSGSFDIDTPVMRNHSSRHRDSNGNFAGESSSDLSSSDVDIPLLIRPTLPQRKMDLPRFSPSAAWRALDSPRASGRSLSSEDGFTYEDRIHRLTRPCAPPRSNNERSGDSGISAGDAGSPANPLPDMIGGRTSSCSFSNTTTTNNITKIKNKIRKNREDSPTKGDSHIKCWTPEQDLDETESDDFFEHDVDLSLHDSMALNGGIVQDGIILDSSSQLGGINSMKSIANNHHINGCVPPGLQTPPKFTTRSQLFAKHPNGSGTNGSSGFISDGADNKFTFTKGGGVSSKANGISTNGFELDSHGEKNYQQRQHLYARSSKAKSKQNHSSIVEINNDDNFGSVSLNQYQQQHIVHNVYNKSQNGSKYFNRNQQQQSGGRERNGFGSSSNWFLSRSEPNSLNTLDLLEDDEAFAKNKNNHSNISRKRLPKQAKLSVMRRPSEPLDLLDKVFSAKPSRREDHYLKESRRRGDDVPPHFGAPDDVDIDYDEDEEDELMMGSREVHSEIGYGPSSMDFQSQSPPFDRYDEDSKANSLILFRRPFSHIMYLPSYDSRRFYHHQPSSSSYYPNNRRTKSVDNLDSAESNKLYRSNKNYAHYNNNGDYHHDNYLNSGSNSNLTDLNHHRHLNSYQENNNSSKNKISERFTKTDTASNNNNNSPFGRSQSVPVQKLKSGKPRIIEHKIVQQSNAEQEQVDKKKSQAKGEPQSHNKDFTKQQQQQQEEESNRKKKFKFQSTLRVLERKKIEEQLSKQCEDKEMQRLREIESMRRVEEEFQRKRAHKENLELELNFNKLNGTGVSTSNHLTSQGDWSDINVNINDHSGISNASGSSISRENNNSSSSNTRAFLKNDVGVGGSGSKSTPSVITTSTNNSCSINSRQSSQLLSSSPHHHRLNETNNNNKNKISSNGNHSNSKLILAQRQEPEGASSPSGTDLRKELIHASRKRNGTSHHNGSNSGHGGHGGSSELTQELSEMRQESARQYCDYRRSPRTTTSSPSRFVESSSSDIFPLSRRTPIDRNKPSRYRYTVHPEIICDIPVKPYPYMVNFSRLSGSTSNLLEERPSSGLGLGSGPSSVISDNYRRDWANIRGSGASSGHPGRASSVASFPDHIRHSSTDLTALDSPHVHHKRKSPLYQKYSNSPPASPIPPMSALSSNISDLTDPEKDGQSSILTTTSGVFQLQPFNKTKGYKPVAFKPVTPTTNHAIKLTSTTVK